MSETTAGDDTDVTISPAARTFVVTATGASLAAFNLGFDLGAFNNIDHRKIWDVWVICTVALISSYLFRDDEYRLGGRWRFVLLVPSLWLIADAPATSSPSPRPSALPSSSPRLVCSPLAGMSATATHDSSAGSAAGGGDN